MGSHSEGEVEMTWQGSLQAWDPEDVKRKSRRREMRGANVTPVPDKEGPIERNMKGGLGNRVIGRVAKLRHLVANQQTRLRHKAEPETREAEKILGQGVWKKGRMGEPGEETPLADGMTLRKGESRVTG